MKLKHILIGITLGALLIFLNDQFLFESVLVPSSSMMPTIAKNERLFLQRRFYAPIKRFDIVVIKSQALKERIIKRVIGLPGDCIQLKSSWEVWLNGQALHYEASSEDPDFKVEEDIHSIQLKRNPKFFYETKFANEPLCLQAEEYFVLGDNRLASGDGRDFGPIKRSEIEGRAVWRWYSYDKDHGHLRFDRMFQSVK